MPLPLLWEHVKGGNERWDWCYMKLQVWSQPPPSPPSPTPELGLTWFWEAAFFFCLSKWLGRVWPPYFKKTMQRNWKFSFKFVLYMHKLNSTRHNMFFLRYTGYESGWLIKILDCPSDEWCLSHRTQTTGLPQGHIGCVHLECVCN